MYLFVCMGIRMVCRGQYQMFSFFEIRSLTEPRMSSFD